MDKEELSTAEDLAERNNWIEQLMRMWHMFINVEAPSARQFGQWYELHQDNPMRIVYAISKTSAKEEIMEDAGETMSLDHAVRFCSSIANVQKTIEQKENDNDK